MSQPARTVAAGERGDAVKIDSWPQAVVVVVGLVATAGVTVALVHAGWSGEAIIGFATLAAGLFAGQLVSARKASAIEAKTDHQTEKIDTIVEQTNGRSDAEIEAIAARAADLAAVKVIQAYRSGGMR